MQKLHYINISLSTSININNRKSFKKTTQKEASSNFILINNSCMKTGNGSLEELVLL